MRRWTQSSDESFVDMHFPLAGIDLSSAFSVQPVHRTPKGQYARTTPDGRNVRAFDPATGRARGASRPGMSKYIAARLSGSNLIQDLAGISGVGYTAPGGGVQTSQSGRVVTLVGVSQGNVAVADAGATAWTTPTNGTGALISSGVILSAPNQQKLYFADGTNAKYYDPSNNTVSAWTATAGSLPVGSDAGTPRLIETWRGRTVLSGLIKDPQNWFMSAVGSPTDFDYSPAATTPTQAVAGNNSTLGKVGETITSMISFTDDMLFFGCLSSLWMMRGDPMAGGQLDKITNAVGMAWGRPWCIDPYGNIYFVSNRMGIYVMTPGSLPQRISQQVEQLLSTVNTGTNTIRMLWDDRYQGMHVFVSRTASATAAVHLFWEQRTAAWWTDSFSDPNFNPLCCTVFDGNTAGDRVSVIGSWDGYVRYLDPDATTDDGREISSYVMIGPFNTPNLDEVLLREVQAALGEDSGDVTWAVHVGDTPEMAASSVAVATGTWGSGRNPANYIQRAAHAVYIKISATEPWAMESIRCRLALRGRIRMRT